MKFTIKTLVQGFTPLEVYSIFDFELLSALSPPFVKTEALVYEGNKTGDRIAFMLHSPLGRWNWTGRITENHISENVIYFTDEGEKMPLGLTAWKHTHKLIKSDKGCTIEDRIVYQGKNHFHTVFIFPLIWSQFIYRKPLYEAIIRKRLELKG